MCFYAGKRGREAEAVGEHVFVAGDAKFFAKVMIAIEHVAHERLGGGDVVISLVDAGAAGEPAAGGDVFFELFVFGRVILLHHFVAARAGEIEDVVGVFIEQSEVVVQGIGEVFADGLGVGSSRALRVGGGHSRRRTWFSALKDRSAHRWGGWSVRVEHHAAAKKRAAAVDRNFTEALR